MMNILKQLEGYFSGKVAIFKTVASIFKLEMKLAALSFYPFIINICLILVLIMSFWLISITLIGYFLYLWLGGIIPALLSILFLNLLLILVIHRLIKFNLKKMSLEKTRTYFLKKGRLDNEQFAPRSDVAIRKNVQPTK